MNIICNKNILNEVIASVSKAVSSHSNFPVLEGILIKAELDGTVYFISNDIVFYSIRKELNKMIDDKAKYIKTSSPAYMRNVNTVNLNFAYRVFCLDNLNIKNVELLFKLYERGVTPYDFLLEKEDEI